VQLAQAVLDVDDPMEADARRGLDGRQVGALERQHGDRFVATPLVPPGGGEAGAGRVVAPALRPALPRAAQPRLDLLEERPAEAGPARGRVDADPGTAAASRPGGADDLAVLLGHPPLGPAPEVLEARGRDDHGREERLDEAGQRGNVRVGERPDHAGSARRRHPGARPGAGQVVAAIM
jgi:hypothetical protein